MHTLRRRRGRKRNSTGCRNAKDKDDMNTIISIEPHGVRLSGFGPLPFLEAHLMHPLRSQAGVLHQIHSPLLDLVGDVYMSPSDSLNPICWKSLGNVICEMFNDSGISKACRISKVLVVGTSSGTLLSLCACLCVLAVPRALGGDLGGSTCLRFMV